MKALLFSCFFLLAIPALAASDAVFYPNPVRKDQASLSCNLGSPATLSLWVFNSAGRRVLELSEHHGEAKPVLSLKLGGLARGIYFWRLGRRYDNGQDAEPCWGKFSVQR